MKTRFLGCGMIVLSALLTLLWIQIKQGRQEIIKIMTEAGIILGVLFLFGLAVFGIMLFLEGGIPED